MYWNAGSMLEEAWIALKYASWGPVRFRRETIRQAERKHLAYLELGWIDWGPERSDIDISGRKYLVTYIQFLYFILSS
jgi:hypothetical protein